MRSWRRPHLTADVATPKDSNFNSSTWSNVPDNYDKLFKSSESKSVTPLCHSQTATTNGEAQISGNSRGIVIKVNDSSSSVSAQGTLSASYSSYASSTSSAASAVSASAKSGAVSLQAPIALSLCGFIGLATAVAMF